MFFFIYNGVKNKNLDPGFDSKEFCQGRNVAVEFTNHAINFKTVAKPDGTFSYNFKLHGIYLINSERKFVSTPSKKKRGPND